MQSSIIQKVLTVLTVISEARKPPTFSDIVRKSGLNKSTVHRLLAICTSERLVRHDDRAKAYFLGPRMFDLVRNAHDGLDIQTLALDEMVSLYERYNANVTLGIPSGLEVVYVRVLEATHLLGNMQRPGMRDPIHCSASGKALLAYLPERVTRARLKDYDFTRFTPRTLTNVEDFLAALATVREQGFAMNDREEYEHLVGVSAPIFNHLGEAVAVLNIWSVYPEHRVEDLLGWADSLKAAAKRVTTLLGGAEPAAVDG